MSTLSVAMIQYDIDWLDKKSNLEHLDSIISAADPTDLLVLPETFSTGFSIDVDGCEEPVSNGKVLDWMKRKAEQISGVVAGSVLVSKGEKKANRFYWVRPDGSFDYYDKRHLFRLGNEQNFVEPGQHRKTFEINQTKILPLVCYDLRFPVWSRNRQDYEVIVNVANWPAARRNVWDTLLKARAIENQAYVIGVNRVGDDAKGVAHSGGTAIYDFNGETIEKASDNKEALIQSDIDLSVLREFKEKFSVHLDADHFEIQ